MKEQYEDKIEELQGQQEKLEEQLQTVRNEVKSGATSSGDDQGLLEEVQHL